MYGAGAESKMRINETLTNAKKINDGYREAPIPEGRMRALEQSRYPSTPVEVSNFLIETKKPKRTQHVASKSNVAAANIPSYSTKNPFDDDNDDYDDSKNPFADEVDSNESIPKKTKEEEATNNPFGDYDDNLNPFE